MSIRHRKVGNRVYLEQYRSYREGGKVKTEFVKYLGREGKTPSKPLPPQHLIDQIKPSDSVRAGDVNLLWSIAQDLQIPQTIDRICCQTSGLGKPSPGILFAIWAINRVIDPESATQLEAWVSTTDLPRLAQLPADAFNKDAFLSALDRVCDDKPELEKIVDLGSKIEDALYRTWRENNHLPKGENEMLAYDLTSALFFGVTCPLAEFGHNPDNITDRLQVNLALLVTKRESMPVSHAVFEGSRHGVATLKTLFVKLPNVPKKGTIIWDRGMVSKEHIGTVREMGWELICGLPKTITAVQRILDEVVVQLRPETIARCTKTTHIYAAETKANLYGKEERVVIYTNNARATQERDARNGALAKITASLDVLSGEAADWPEAKLHQKIADITGHWKQFIVVSVSRKKKPRITWRYRQHALREAERRDGRWALLVTDPNVTAKEAVNEYLEKDFIEKGFRTMKTDEQMEPIRHRLERRVRAYLFVQVLALRIRSELRWRIKKNDVNGEQNAWEVSDDLLRALGRVERLKISIRKEQRTWYLNLQKSTTEILKKIGYGSLFAH